MKFLFRTPLFDFDPQNEVEILQNWSKILAAISVSSPSLFNEVCGWSFKELPKALRLKVKKYILRGRYRSTPFGKLAGVGLGKTELQKFSIDLDQTTELRSKIIPINIDHEDVVWHLSSGGFNQFDRKIFLSYQIKEERWALLGIPSNVIIDLLINHFKNHRGIRFSEFRSWFKDDSPYTVDEIWMNLIEIGILYSNERWLKSQIQASVFSDIVLTDELGISTECQSLVDDFFKTAGNLFVRSNSTYLDQLKKWFQVKFDDRFIPLTLLLSYSEFTSSDFFEVHPNGESTDTFVHITSSSWGLEEVDLRMIIKEAPLAEELFHVDLVIKALDDGGIIIENTVCNRPFVFIGRFNRQKEVMELAKQVKEKIYTDRDLIYAEVRLFENHIAQGICATEPIFDKYISPFYHEDSGCIPLEDIEIGLRDGAFILIHNQAEKRIIPIVTHPLNGKQISHPLMRLLWELDHQKGFKLAHFQSPEFVTGNYSPRLIWGKTILQSRRWVVYSNQFEIDKELSSWLKKEKLPPELLIGIYDRELLINWENDDDFEILWTELKRHPKCVLSEVLWKNKSPYSSTLGRAVYPQLIQSHRKPIKETPWKGFLNSIERENLDWLYVVFWVEEDDFEDSMLLLLSFDFFEYLKKNHFRWYFLVYPEDDKIQVRLRFLMNSINQKSEILSFIFHNLGTQLRFEQRPYYPEVKKYGKNTIQISEELFWMESLLVAEIIIRTSGKDGSRDISVSSLSNFWVDLICASGIECYGFEKIKTKVKRMSIELKRSFASDLGLLRIQRKLPVGWKEEYKLKLMTHLHHWEKNEMKWQVISNHLHMQVNRFYSINRKRMEDWLYYLLYKEMGKRRYGNGKA